MTTPDQEGLIFRNVINKDDAGARGFILLSSEIPPGKVHVLHQHPNAELIMYVLEGSCLALSGGEPVPPNEVNAVFIAQDQWHGVRNDTDRPAVTLVVYSGGGILEEAGYEEHPRHFDQKRSTSNRGKGGEFARILGGRLPSVYEAACVG
jgi:quercetin dioxygenase-like cupin family protein